ncbi:Cys-tRNA(Pro)/Cys-tRNA(Cys) deacylase [Actinopolyspora biskrensis]|uniref:Cys-tRNA(Pro)/Cys-tRNA(Cys) deacylase n=1 Tax=Actinopolyspora biskrensis TaxID=1470178 RepID=A0A852Z507_9ACTN|nr:aminoacyl-tRNA deacylase [Actinopolyspora biskrensis]NYH81102.1 Cys-tRNA(Pro)/Cys-tRNA(Cys) deacylase [Actinopolyspora biskrensis]
MVGRSTPATALLDANGIPYRLHGYDHRKGTRSYGAEAVEQLGVPAARVLKTLVALVDGSPVTAVLAVERELAPKALARARHGRRAVLADSSTAQRRTGYHLGAVSPLARKTSMPLVLDSAATEFDTVYVSAGRRGLEIELAPSALRELTGASTASISR